MGRFGDPDELGGATVFLACEASKFITGTVIPVDGGHLAFSGV
jgi:NAD(P)-dependent dehydrogenase (short-subunit alcohol dehydrogenase family)